MRNGHSPPAWKDRGFLAGVSVTRSTPTWLLIRAFRSPSCAPHALRKWIASPRPVRRSKSIRQKTRKRGWVRGVWPWEMVLASHISHVGCSIRAPQS